MIRLIRVPTILSISAFCFLEFLVILSNSIRAALAAGVLFAVVGMIFQKVDGVLRLP